MSWEDSTPDERQASTSRMAYKEMGRANELQKKLDAAVRRAIASEDLLMSRAQQHADAESEATRLRAKLLDAKRNEERAVAEVTKLLDDRQKGDRLSFSHLQLRDISRRTGLKYLRRARESEAKLNTLEAAVRAVLNDPGSMYPLDREVVVELIALVES